MSWSEGKYKRGDFKDFVCGGHLRYILQRASPQPKDEVVDKCVDACLRACGA